MTARGSIEASGSGHVLNDQLLLVSLGRLRHGQLQHESKDFACGSLESVPKQLLVCHTYSSVSSSLSHPFLLNPTLSWKVDSLLRTL